MNEQTLVMLHVPTCFENDTLWPSTKNMILNQILNLKIPTLNALSFGNLNKLDFYHISISSMGPLASHSPRLPLLSSVDFKSPWTTQALKVTFNSLIFYIA